jgi:hypothetical protein
MVSTAALLIFDGDARHGIIDGLPAATRLFAMSLAAHVVGCIRGRCHRVGPA